MDSSLVLLTPPVKPTGDEIVNAVNYPRTGSAKSVNSQRRVTISSFVPPNDEKLPPATEEEKFVDARNFSTPEPEEKKRVRIGENRSCVSCNIQPSSLLFRSQKKDGEKRQNRSKSAPGEPRIKKLFSEEESGSNEATASISGESGTSTER